MFIDPGRLEVRLRDEFGGTMGQSRVVVRQAVDLADSGQYEDDVGATLTNDVVVEELSDAPEGPPTDRWNWWIGSLELAYGGYGQFGIRRYRTEE
ncbi:hypothetical protein [Natronolimnohabitans innermongolicus]|uniref:Uncharacterized protein n=1 Tax=Natronolimnohabitans innermongolicus JCM 12255 TaxID=1227499 RepID=L9WUY5_9EURY|nr:hypothetical protein [Natronolimnohabitans innermongolicus]ELY53232.1 hypothetical protein C493_14418 [Natronolimnohabitans innermongolicus JCM 12255]